MTHDRPDADQRGHVLGEPFHQPFGDALAGHGDCRRAAEIPLAGARQGDHQLRCQDQWQSKGQHQFVGARRHASKGGRGRRRRLFRHEVKSYGNLVLVRHANGYVTAYAHASEVLVKRGDAIKRGQVIAKSGQSGEVGSPQLHFEIRKGSSPVNPLEFLNGA